MKGGAIYGIKGLKFPFIIGTLICAMILVGWKKTPLLTAILPSQNRFLGMSPDVLFGSPVFPPPSEIHMHKDNHSPVPLRNETSNKNDRHAGAQQDLTVSPKDDIRRRNKDILFGSPVTSLPSQQTAVVGYESSTFERKEIGHKPEGTAVDVEVKNVSAKYPTQPCSKGTSPSRDDISSELAGIGISSPVSVSSSKISPVASMEGEGNSTNQVNMRSCNYAQGKWVADEKRPFYSGASCKQWLSAMWACRMTQRTDFSYEKFRWLPLFCEMEEFEGSKFLRRMQDKTLAFIGDSLARQQFQSLMCMITSGQDRNGVINVGWEYGLVKALGAKRPDGWAYRFTSTNTTILFYWSACLCDLQSLNHQDPQTEIAMHLDRPPSFLARFIPQFHVLVLNTGHHWNSGKINGNRWVMYVKGKPNTDQEIQDIRKAKNFTLHNIVQWVDSRLKDQPGLKAFLRSMSPRHFFNGDWDTGGTCDNTTPLSRGKEVLKEESSDLVSARAVEGTKVKFLDITALSELRDEGHISKYSVRGTMGTQDCLHWCLPGIPDTWNEILFAQL